MTPIREISRRSLWKLLVPAFAAPLFARANASRAAYGASANSTRVNYRADAVILVFGISIFSKAGVGSGFAFVEDSSAPGAHRYGFGGGSWPDRARGLNRLGYIHEDVVEEAGHFAQGDYFGFMTSSQEEKMDEAKEALKNGKGENLFSAIQGESRRGAYSANFTRFESPASGGWRVWRKIAEAAERSFTADRLSHRTESGTPRDAAATLPTLLYSIARFHANGLRPSRSVFIYGGVPRELEMNIAPDARMGERLRQRGLTSDAASVMQMTGVTRNVKTGAKTRFHLWWDRDAASPIPLRIEMEPRSFLRLAFEADPSIQV